MTFRVGMKVACIDDEPHSLYTPWAHHSDMDGLKKGTVYTVRSVGLYNGVPCIWLHEIVRGIARGWEELGEAGFSPKRFRPVVERKTDISFAHEILRKVSDRVPA